MAQVAVTFETSFDFDGTSGTSSSFTIAAGEGLLVFIGLEVTGKAVSSVIWDLTTPENLAKPSSVPLLDPTHGKEALEVWWLSNPTPGTDTLTVNVSEEQRTGVIVCSVTNFDTETPFSDRQTQENGSATAGDVTVSEGVDDLGICLGAYFKTTSTFTPADTETEVAELSVQSVFELGVFTQDGDGSISIGWTHGGGTAECAVLGFTIDAAPPAIDAIIRTARFATPTSTGNVDVTTADLGGKTPKAVIIIANHADTDGAAEDGLALGVGFADATREGSASISSQHAQTTTSTRRRFRTVLVIDLIVGATAQVTANFVSFITNGVRLNFTVVDSDAQLFTVIFFAGDDLSAHSDSINLGTGTSALDQTAPSFQPDLVFVAGCAIVANSQSGFATLHFGVAVRDGLDTNRGISWSSGNALGTSSATLQMHTDSIGGQITTSQTWEASIDSFDASGFSITPSANAGNDVVIYLAISVGGLSAWVGSLDSPTSTGDDAQTGPGFKPQFVMLGMTAAQVEDTVESDADAGPIGFSVFDKDGNEFSTVVVEEDAVTTTNNQSLADNQAVNFPNDAGTQIMASTFSTMDANGWTLNFSVADGTVRKWFGVAIEEAAAADVTDIEFAGTLGLGKQEPVREKNEIVSY